MLSNITTRLINALSKISVEKENVVGVDITPGNIRVAQLERVKNDWVLSKLGYKYVEGARHLHEIRDDPDVYIEKLKQVIASSKVSTKNAAISVPVSSSIIKTVFPTPAPPNNPPRRTGPPKTNSPTATFR